MNDTLSENRPTIKFQINTLPPSVFAVAERDFADKQAVRMTKYYQVHAEIYDATRWTFLFGRRWLLDWLPYGWADKFTVVEVGCGTGFNIRGLAARFPKARLVGLDIAVPMLSIAEKECQNVPNSLIFKKLAYGSADEGSPDFFGNGSAVAEKPNVVLFSYCLTMVNPDWQRLVLQAKNDLPRGGKLAIVDFHDSPFALFRRWMRFNHVEMTGEILPFLQQHFSTVKVETRRAYFGLWRYFLFIGEKV